MVTYELKCDQGTTAKRIDNTSKDSQKDCANFCSEHPDCQSADYDWGTKNCARFSEVSRFVHSVDIVANMDYSIFL